MPYKCCVTGCFSNYDTLKKRQSTLKRKAEPDDELPTNNRRKPDSRTITTFSLPSCDVEKQSWLKNIPRDNIPLTKNTRVCYRHWPADFRRKKVRGGGVRPIDPPTVFDNCDIPKSAIPTPCPPSRTTERSSALVRSVEPDQINDHNQLMRVEFENINHKIHEHVSDIICYVHNNTVHIQSVNFAAGGVHKFLVKINPDLSYEAYQGGVRCFISTLIDMNIHRLQDWGQVIEVFRYLNVTPPSIKSKIIAEDIESLSNVKIVGKKVYELDKVLRAFEYFATSRAAYTQFSEHYQLPSISMLTKLTSKCTSLSELDFIGKVFENLDEKQRQCNVLVDEIFVKPQLLYHGGQLFGKAANNPSVLATSVLAVMLTCSHGGPKFIAKLIPVNKLTGEYQFNIVKNIITAVTKAGGKVVSIIADDNKVNQKFFKLFPVNFNHPWVTYEFGDVPANIFLLFDFVHLFKSVRNNWYTEKLKEICYQHPTMTEPQTAKWIDISNMYKLDVENDTNKYVPFAHKLTSVAVSPKPIERQNVNFMLKVFCDETVAALRSHPQLNRENIEPTAHFIELWVEIWTILNVKQPFTDKRLVDPRRAEFRDTRDIRLQRLEEMAVMVEKMDCRNGKLNIFFPFESKKYVSKFFSICTCFLKMIGNIHFLTYLQ